MKPTLAIADLPECSQPMIDVHCHLLPGFDDGAKSWDEALSMARIAAEDGIATIIATPHQLGAFQHNRAASIRSRTTILQQFLTENNVKITVLPGADVRVQSDLVAQFQDDQILSLADQRRYLLLDLPHEVYYPLKKTVASLTDLGCRPILSHPERNQGLIKRPDLIKTLVDQGCLMQLTAGSITGASGQQAQSLAEWMILQGLVHLIATDAHGAMARRPLMSHAYRHVAALAGNLTAAELCCRNPAAVIDGRELTGLTRRRQRTSWIPWRRAA